MTIVAINNPAINFNYILWLSLRFYAFMEQNEISSLISLAKMEHNR